MKEELFWDIKRIGKNGFELKIERRY